MKRDPYESDIVKDLELRLHVERTRADSYQFVLRDQFAIAALPVMLQTYWDEVNRGRPVEPDWREGNAMEAYKLADAMLAAREAK